MDNPAVAARLVPGQGRLLLEYGHGHVSPAGDAVGQGDPDDAAPIPMRRAPMPGKSTATARSPWTGMSIQSLTHAVAIPDAAGTAKAPAKYG